MQRINSNERDILSVIIPITRMAGKLSNLEKTFEECPEEKVEFILVHDEQDSVTQIELEALLSKFEDINIRLFRKTFNSPGLARNYGVQHSTGSWFCFADSDDLPHISNLIRTTVDAENLGAKVGLGNMLVVNGDHEKLLESTYLCNRRRQSIATFALNPSFGRFVFRSEELNSVTFPKIKMGEDQVYVANTNFLDFEIYFSNLLLYTYFIDLPDQATKNKALAQAEITLQDNILQIQKDYKVKQDAIEKIAADKKAADDKKKEDDKAAGIFTDQSSTGGSDSGGGGPGGTGPGGVGGAGGPGSTSAVGAGDIGPPDAVGGYYSRGKLNYRAKNMAMGGATGYALGGLGSLGGYSDGGRLLRGPGDGVSDSIPATIGRKQQPARLADGEFVVPARIVSELGNGSTDAGAKKLYAMLDRVQRARGKTTGKNKVAANSRSDKYLPA